MQEVFEKLRAMAYGMDKNLPEMPSIRGFMGKLFRGQSDEKEKDERIQKWCMLFNAVLQDRRPPLLSSDERFTNLIGMKNKPGEWDIASTSLRTDVN